MGRCKSGGPDYQPIKKTPPALAEGVFLSAAAVVTATIVAAEYAVAAVTAANNQDNDNKYPNPTAIAVTAASSK